MVASDRYSYWLPRESQKISKTFLHHIRGTARDTDRNVSMEGIDTDDVGRILASDFERVLRGCNTDRSFTFDCIQGHGMSHLQQIGALLVSAPNLDIGMTLMLGCISFFDDRVAGVRQVWGDKTLYGIWYRDSLDTGLNGAHFYHTQAASLLLTAVDGWPTHYADNSVMHFPRVDAKYTSTTRQILQGKFPWVEVDFNKAPLLSWEVATKKTKWDAPNFSQPWHNYLIEFVKGTMNHIETERMPWSRFLTNIMMCSPKDMSAKKCADLLQMHEVDLSKKISAEGNSATAIKDWILTETTLHAFDRDIPERSVANLFGYKSGDFRARLKRRGITNPYNLPPVPGLTNQQSRQT